MKGADEIADAVVRQTRAREVAKAREHLQARAMRVSEDALLAARGKLEALLADIDEAVNSYAEIASKLEDDEA